MIESGEEKIDKGDRGSRNNKVFVAGKVFMRCDNFEIFVGIMTRCRSRMHKTGTPQFILHIPICGNF